MAVGGSCYVLGRIVWSPKAFTPRIQYTTDLDLGEHRIGSVAVGRITMSNNGREDLLVDQIRTNCSCSGIERKEEGRFVRVDSLRLKPDEQTELYIRVSVRGVPIGHAMRNTITFRTNDPQEISGRIEAVVRQVLGSLTFTPSSLVLGTVVRGTPIREKFVIRDLVNPPRKITHVTSSIPDKIIARFKSLDPAELPQQSSSDLGTLIGHLELSVDTTTPGPINGFVQVHSEGDIGAPEPLQLTGSVVDSMVLSPPALLLPRHTATGPIYRASVVCRSNRGLPLSVKLTSIPAGLTVELLPSEPDSASRVVQVSWDRRQPIPTHQEKKVVSFHFIAGGEMKQIDLSVTVSP